MQTYTPYQERIRECFAHAFRFFDKHKHPRTDTDWIGIIEGIAPYKDPLTIGLLGAVIDELEREYRDSQIKE